MTVQRVGGALPTNGQVLTANSAVAGGAEWASLPSSGSMTLIHSGDLTNVAGLTISNVNQNFRDLIVDVMEFNPPIGSAELVLRPNNVSSTYFSVAGNSGINSTNGMSCSDQNQTSNDGGFSHRQQARFLFRDYRWQNSRGVMVAYSWIMGVNSSGTGFGSIRVWTLPISSAITSLNFNSSATLQRGTIRVWGVL